MFTKILSIFLIWRISLFLVAFLAVLFIPVFGSSFPYVDQVLKITGLPSWIWGFGNFDGVHYLRIAQNGYSAQFTQAFFPLYPILINLLNFFPRNPALEIRTFVDPSYFYTAIILSNIFFFGALLMFYKLTKLDFNQKDSFNSTILLLAFPTSFYFGSIYTEPLFLLLSIVAFYFMRKDRYIFSGIFIALATATRIVGLFLIPALLIEIYLHFKKKGNLDNKEYFKALLGIIASPMGILLYMNYLSIYFHNAFYFFTSLPSFGTGRSVSSLVLLPQVVYRYLKIFITVPLQSASFFNAFLEFTLTIAALLMTLVFFKKMRPSYFVFTLGCLILPTLTGTFTSMPRYCLMSFLLLPFLYQAMGRYYKLLVGWFIIGQIILVTLFIRGYWIA